MKRMEWLRGLVVLAALITLATGLGAKLTAAPAVLTPAEAALVRGGAPASGDCDSAQDKLYGCIIPDDCKGSLANNCNGSCKGSCATAGIYTDNYKSGNAKKADTDCGNEWTGATCVKRTPKNSDPYCGCDGGMDSGAAGTCGAGKKGFRECN